MRVNLLYHRIGHHSTHSGYDQLVSHLSSSAQTEKLDAWLPAEVSEQLIKWALKRSRMTWYDRWSLGLELAALRHAAQRPGEIYHYLYGEDSYRFLGYLGRRFSRDQGKIVCSFHQPPSIAQGVLGTATHLSKLDAIIVVGSNQVPYFASFVGRARVHVIPHGIDVDFFQPSSSKPRLPRRCLCVGQWLRDFRTLDAISELLYARDRRIELVVISSDPPSCLANRPNVTVRTGVSEEALLEAYQEATVFVLPLEDCTANNALLEAMACGLPIVTNDVGAVGDYVNADCGTLAPRGDAEGMVRSILGILGDPQRRFQMGDASRGRALELQWREVAKSCLSVYEQLASEL